MKIQTPRAGAARLILPVVAVAVAVVACTDQQPLAVKNAPVAADPAPTSSIAAFDCVGSTVSRTISCKAQRPGGDVSAVVTGGQNTFLKLTSSNLSYNSGTEIFQFDVTVQNLMNEAMGSPDGTVADPEGIQVFFHSGPTTTGGSGTVTVANADGTGTFTGTNQPFFAYNQILAKDQTSGAKTWQLNVPSTVTSFNFVLLVETDIQYLLVINEVLVNPGGTITDASGEWFEVYNAGSRKVHMQNLVIADSAASGRRPYHVIATALDISPGAYVTFGNTTNTTNNGGVPVDYAYGAALQLANSLDAVKIARVYGTDTLTVDRTQFAASAVSAQNGISRELLNPALDNSNMDGSNWADALVTAVYGPGGRGTPKAQNSTFTP
jgi:hypothetical protein